MNINCVIIDDEPLAIKVIKNHLQEFKNIVIVDTFNNPIEAMHTIESNKIDVIFLDINMPKMSGLEFLRNTKIKPYVIITTAYREFAIEGYDLDVLDYLVKPIPFPRFLKTINKLTQRIQSNNTDIEITKNSHIFLKVDKKLVKIKHNDILYIESLKDYIKVTTIENNYVVHKSLTSITEELPSEYFLRIHRSYTIASDKVNYIEGNSLNINNKRIPIGRKYLNITKQIILKTNDE
ncbi:LytR/AlgR family response regulator transcription factor [Tenacibaculum soleae]|uniref:DNA-binding response regulator n=1 Tax=Tenacibaculum soleae TaxID=447689 RepID=A0A1B9XZ47_9FLAO|nr:response regulator transcription factor [Tenacibaculum soleae]MDO6743718.1 response regulator transcription factor [Tenacibaculum soleae]MDO6812118.1 response regulator transcription factor [Tenacibaculum soleae]OCK42799.1 DNA-binding response regulator [Tenacibaculum soleae]